MPQSGAATIRSAGSTSSVLAQPAGHRFGGFGGGVGEIDHPDHDLLGRQLPDDGQVELRLGGLDGDLVGDAGVELRQERVTGRLRLHRVGIAETEMDDRGAGGVLQGVIDRPDGVLPGLFRPRLHPGFVELNHVGAGGEQVGDLLPDDLGKRHDDGFLVPVMLVDRHLGERERGRAGSS